MGQRTVYQHKHVPFGLMICLQMTAPVEIRITINSGVCKLRGGHPRSELLQVHEVACRPVFEVHLPDASLVGVDDLKRYKISK